jgi:uncharacterized membrane protein
MESRVKFLGHPVHPMLIVLPVGLLSIGVVFDVVYIATKDALFAEVAYWNITVGIIGGLLAALFGFLDWLALPTGTRAKAIGAWHGGGNVLIVLLFAISWLLRQAGGHAYLPNILPFVLALTGAVLALGTAWLGAELVYRMRVGVDADANVNATNSLAHEGVVSVDSRARRSGDARSSG